MDADKVQKFVDAYADLCKAHGFFISSCGCCGSPWITTIDDEKDLPAHVEHLSEGKLFDSKGQQLEVQ